MKHIFVTICAASLLLGACNNDAKSDTNTDTTTTTSTDKSKDMKEPWVEVPDSVAMQAMMAAGTPGKEHAMMASWNGEWQGEMSSWMSPDAPPTVNKVTAVNSTQFGNRFQNTKVKGNTEWGPFEGAGTTAYDNTKKEFVMTWMDNMSTAIMYLRGPWDESSKTMTLTGKMADPSRAGKECDIKQVYKIIDDKNQLLEMYGPNPKNGEPFKMMEIKYTRK